MLGGCVTDGTTGQEPLTRNLPNPPSYLKPVPEPVYKRNDDTYMTALRLKQGLRKANKIITETSKWYGSVKKHYSTSPKRRWFGQ